MSDNFAKGVNLKTIPTQYGEMISVGINTEKIFENPMNGQYVNFIFKKAKSGKWYAQNNEYKKEQTNQNLVEFNEINENELPF